MVHILLFSVRRFLLLRRAEPADDDVDVSYHIPLNIGDNCSMYVPLVTYRLCQQKTKLDVLGLSGAK